ncbi:hypothetical protein SVAN01_06707 [Stagonosporopsis vannaccii]|nr:hypothetical protein SVAN01_06707 [Stagonosporopsis vannaccii]
MKAATDCLLPTEHTGAIDHPTYLGCSCNNKLLRTLNDVREICGLSCDKKDEAVIEQYYGRICGVTGPYVTSSSVAPSPVRPSYTAPVKASDTTSTMVVVSAQSSLPAIARPQEDIEAPNSWAHKHWKTILEGVLIPVAALFLIAAVAALYAWYTRILHRRRQRPMTDGERERYQDRLLQERLEELGLRPLQTVDNSLKGRIDPRRNAATARDPISNRRPRRSNLSISTTVPLRSSSMGIELRTWTPQRPGSVGTVAGSDEQPLSHHRHLAPPLPAILSAPHHSALANIPHTPQNLMAHRSFSSPAVFPGAVVRPAAPYLPLVENLVGHSPLVRSLHLYKQDMMKS